MSHQCRYGRLCVAVFAVAVAVRFIPVGHSPLPTPHAYTYVPPTNHVVEAGRLLVAGRTDHFVFFAWMAQLSLVTDIEPVVLLRPVNAVIGALPAILAVASTRRIGDHLQWPTTRTWTAAGLAGLFIGIEGLYLYRSMAPHPNTIGLFVLPLVALYLYRAALASRRSWWVVGGILLLFVVPLHVFVGLVTAIIVTVLAALAMSKHGMDRPTVIVIAGAVLLWVYIPLFHLGLSFVTPTEVAYTERVRAMPGLFLAWIVAGTLASVWLLGQRDDVQRALGWAAFGLLFGLLALNAVTPVFQGAPSTPLPMLLGFGPLFVLVFLGISRLPDLDRIPWVGLPLLAIMAGPLIVIGVVLTGPPTAVHLGTAERANYFFHFPIMVLAGLGAAGLLSRINRRPHLLSRGTVATVLVICAVASIPIVLAGVPLLPYENKSDRGQLSATQFTITHQQGTWSTDGHLHDIAVRIAPGNLSTPHGLADPPANVTTGPVYRWMRDEVRGPPTCPVLTKGSWIDRGAMFYPAPSERLTADALAGLHHAHHVVFTGGATDRITLTLPTDHSGAGCSAT